MQKRKTTLAAVLIAGLCWLPVQQIRAQGDAARLEREIKATENQISVCKGQIERLEFGGSGRIISPNYRGPQLATEIPKEKIDQLYECLVAARIRLKLLRERWRKLPPAPIEKEPKSPPPKDDEAERKKLLGELIDVLEKRLAEMDADAKRAMEELEKRKRNEEARTAGFSAETTSQGGLSTTTFTTPHGRLYINLPSNMRAGDTISGTVAAEPNGASEEERARNLAALTAYELKIGYETYRSPKGGFTWKMPKSIMDATPSPSPTSSPKPLDSYDPQSYLGKAVEGFELVLPSDNVNLPVELISPIAPEIGLRIEIREDLLGRPLKSDSSSNKTEIPKVGQNGAPLEIKGNFDGDARTTQVRIGNQPATVLAESPRGGVFKSPDQLIGPTEIVVKENNVETKGTYRNVGVNLKAPKTNLMKGERTAVTIEVRGLEGIKEEVPLQLRATGVINMERGNFQNLLIRPTDVQPGGRFTTTREITGLVAGGFGVTVTVVVDRYDACLAGFGGFIRWNTFTGNYIFTRRAGASAGGAVGAAAAGGGQSGAGSPSNGGTPTGSAPPLTGTGKVTMKDCVITLTDNRIDRRVFARLDGCTNTGNAEVETIPDKTKTEIKDANAAGSSCQSK